MRSSLAAPKNMARKATTNTGFISSRAVFILLCPGIVGGTGDLMNWKVL